MSLILDALRKSERTRQQSLSGKLGAGDDASGAGRVPVPWTTLLGLLLMVNAVVLAVLFWRGGGTPAVAIPQTAGAVTVVPYRPSVRPLAEEAGAPSAASTLAPPPASTSPVSAPVPAPLQVAGNVPELANLPPAFQQSLPALHLDVHGYAADRAARFVVINLRRYRVGDTLAEGPRLVDIVPGGAVLEYQGVSFLLPP